MPAASLPLSLADASSAVKVAQWQLVQARADHQVAVSQFSESLVSLGNACADVYESACAEAGNGALKARFDALDLETRKVAAYPSGTLLRLRADGAVRAFESRSFVRRLFGIGNAKRVEQANALGSLHRVASDKPLSRDTILASLRAETAGVQQELVRAGFARHQGPLGAALTSARKHVDDGRWAQGHVAYRVEDDLRQLRATPLQEMVAFAHALDKGLRDDFSRKWGTQLAGLERRLDTANRRLDRARAATRLAPVRDARAAEFIGAGLSVPGHDRAMREAVRKELHALQGEHGEFGTLYFTRAGGHAIHTMYGDGSARLSGASVKRELEARHDQDMFRGGAKPRGDALKGYADDLRQRTVRDVFTVNLLQQRALYAAGEEDMQTSWREVRLPAESVDRLVDACRRGTLLQPEGVLFTGRKDGVAIDQTWSGNAAGDGSRVQFEVRGFTSLPVGSHHAYEGENWGRLYAPETCFAVTTVGARGDGLITVVLEERLGAVDAREQAVSLRL